jgi:squalene synthase HpnC
VVTTRSSLYTPISAHGTRADALGALPGLPSVEAVLGRAAGENFRVVSRLLPTDTRGHLMAFYGYARLVDELGDAYEGDRIDALGRLSAEVERALDDPGAAVHPLVAAAVRSVRELGADPGPLRDLVAANRQDQDVDRYPTYADLLAYCALSANPVGRLVLAAFGATTAERAAWSDAVCTGLQLAEHWQDIAEDARAGRVYLPLEDLQRFEVTVDELGGSPPARPELRALVSFEVARARERLGHGSLLVASLRGRAKVAVAGFVAGGHATLDALADQRFDPLAGPARPAAGRVLRHLARLLARPARPARPGGRRRPIVGEQP